MFDFVAFARRVIEAVAALTGGRERPSFVGTRRIAWTRGDGSVELEHFGEDGFYVVRAYDAQRTVLKPRLDDEPCDDAHSVSAAAEAIVDLLKRRPRNGQTH